MFDYRVENKNGYNVFYLSGRADIVGAEILEKEFKKMIEQNQINIIVDFKDVTYFSSTGVRVIIALKQNLDNCGGNFKIVHINRMVEKILKALDLIEMYEIYETFEDAVSVN